MEEQYFNVECLLRQTCALTNLLLFGINDADEYRFLFSCCPVPAPEEVSVATPVLPVATVDGAARCVGSDGPGVLHCLLPDDSGQ